MAYEDILTYQHQIGCSIETLAKEVYLVASTAVRNLSIYWRIKTPETLRKKMGIKNVQNPFLIDDVYGIRILVDSVNEAYLILNKIAQTFPGFLDHDYIAKPKTRVDKLHLKGKKLQLLQFIAYKNGVSFEIQITTKSFHKNNELFHVGYHKEKYS